MSLTIREIAIAMSATFFSDHEWMSAGGDP